MCFISGHVAFNMLYIRACGPLMCFISGHVFLKCALHHGMGSLNVLYIRACGPLM